MAQAQLDKKNFKLKKILNKNSISTQTEKALNSNIPSPAFDSQLSTNKFISFYKSRVYYDFILTYSKKTRYFRKKIKNYSWKIISVEKIYIYKKNRLYILL